jgi:hypothetical protein
MRKIPDEMREEMANDPYYKKCCITGRSDEKIDWHHNLIFAGRQVNEKWAILPLATSIHAKIHEYKDQCDKIMVSRATEDELRPYCKVIDYIKLKRSLVPLETYMIMKYLSHK